MKEKRANMHHIIVSGDQLTAARIRGAQKPKLNAESPEKRLEGLVSSQIGTPEPIFGGYVINYLQELSIIWRYYFSAESTSEHGTLYQLRNSINRTNVVKVPIDSFDANDDFFKLVIEAHIIAAAMKKFIMATLQSSVSQEFAPKGEDSWMLLLEERKQFTASRINGKFFHVC